MGDCLYIHEALYAINMLTVFMHIGFWENILLWLNLVRKIHVRTINQNFVHICDTEEKVMKGLHHHENYPKL